MDVRPEGWEAPPGDVEPRLYPPKIELSERPIAFPAVLAKLISNPIAAWPKSVCEEPLFIQQMPGQKLVHVCDPDLVNTVLSNAGDAFPKTVIDRRLLCPIVGDSVLTAEGEQWRWQRRTTAPLFRHSELLCYVRAMSVAAERVVERWRTAGKASVQRVDRAMTRATFEIIGETMLPYDDDFDKDVVAKYIEDYLAASTWELACSLLRAPTWMPYPRKRKARMAARAIRAAMAELIRQRKGANREGDDLLGRMLAARDPETGNPMSDGKLIDNLITFLLAGHETTASTLTWTLFLLALSPEWQERVAQEARSVAGDAPIEAKHIEQLKSTQMVLKEALRLYPPVPILSRVAARDLDLGGRQFNKGTIFIIPIYAIHRHKQLWDDPDAFDPYRFESELQDGRSRCSFMPFGAGPRICMGASFALIEATTILATLVRQVRFSAPPGLEPEPIVRVTFRPRGGMPLEIGFRET
jgi:cytochrome P450